MLWLDCWLDKTQELRCQALFQKQIFTTRGRSGHYVGNILWKSRPHCPGVDPHFSDITLLALESDFFPHTWQTTFHKFKSNFPKSIKWFRFGSFSSHVWEWKIRGQRGERNSGGGEGWAVWAPSCLSVVFSFDRVSTVCAHALSL